MTPYASYVTGQEPLEVLRANLDAYRAIFARYTAQDWAAPWAEGKWTAHQVLVHVTQWEMIFGTRVRMALGQPGYVVQPMEQDDLLNLEAPVVDTATTMAAFEGLRRMNIALVASLSSAARTRKVQHPERGEIDVEDLVTTLAGHGAHHLTQLTR